MPVREKGKETEGLWRVQAARHFPGFGQPLIVTWFGTKAWAEQRAEEVVSEGGQVLELSRWILDEDE